MTGVWPRISVGSLVQVREASLQTGPFGTQLSASEYVTEGIPIINVRNVGFGDVRADDLEYVSEGKVEQLHHHVLRVGDIVFGRKGAVERHALIGAAQDGWVQGSDCLRLRLGSPRFNVRFVSFYLRTKGHQDWMQALCSFGATMNSLNQDIVNRIELPCPPRSVQDQIAAVLAAYDDLIANNQRRIALLESMAEEIYREWFVRMRFPGAANGVSRVNPPDGWTYVELPKLASITYGFTFAGDRFSELEVGKKIIRIRDVLAGDSKTYTDELADDKYVVRAGDLLIGMDGEFHMNHWIAEDAYLVQRTCRIAPKQERLRAYVAHALKAPISHYQKTIVGATVGHLGAKHLNAIKLLIPPETLNPSLELLNQHLDQRLALSKQNLRLAKSRDALLPRLISGKLRVEALDIQFPPSMQPPPPEAAPREPINS